MHEYDATEHTTPDEAAQPVENAAAKDEVTGHHELHSHQDDARIDDKVHSNDDLTLEQQLAVGFVEGEHDTFDKREYDL
jgi:hypothetical protein